MSETSFFVDYEFRRKPQQAGPFRSLKAAFEFVDDLDNESGGYALSVGTGVGFPMFTRFVNESEGKAYWVSFITGEYFEQYRG